MVARMNKEICVYCEASLLCVTGTACYYYYQQSSCIVITLKWLEGVEASRPGRHFMISPPCPEVDVKMEIAACDLSSVEDSWDFGGR